MTNDQTPEPIAEFDTYALDITWDKPGLPGLVGPFPARQEADDWARVNIPNGSWEVRPLAWPYYRSATRKLGVEDILTNPNCGRVCNFNGSHQHVDDAQDGA